MRNLIVVTGVIAMMFGLVLSAEAGYRGDIAGARSRSAQRVKSNYSLRDNPATGMSATVRKGSRPVVRSAVSRPVTGDKRGIAAARLRSMQRFRSSYSLKGNPATSMPVTARKVSRLVARSAVSRPIAGHRLSAAINRPAASRILSTAQPRTTPDTFRANREGVPRLR